MSMYGLTEAVLYSLFQIWQDMSEEDRIEVKKQLKMIEHGKGMTVLIAHNKLVALFDKERCGNE